MWLARIHILQKPVSWAWLFGKDLYLDKQYGAGGGHFELHACMHPLTVFGNPILDKLASSSHALLTLDAPEISHPAHCNKKTSTWSPWMHCNKNIPCMKLALHQIQSLDSVNPPGMCLKLCSPSTLQQIFHDFELGTDKNEMSGILLHFICTWAPNKKKKLILLVSVVIKNIEGWLKIFTSHVVYSEIIWLYLPWGWSPLFYMYLPVYDCHFVYIEKFIKEAWVETKKIQ
jgi:hypothetical protein